MGISMLTDRFNMKDVQRKQAKKLKLKEGGVKPVEDKKSSKNEMKSSKFFKKMEEITKSDYQKKENKKRAKLESTNSQYVNHSHTNIKKFKM